MATSNPNQPGINEAGLQFFHPETKNRRRSFPREPRAANEGEVSSATRLR